MDVAEQNKCAHPICTCPAAEGSKYCSDSCEANRGRTDIACDCGHTGCLAKAA